MTGDEFKAQALAVVGAHTRGQGLCVMDTQMQFCSPCAKAAALSPSAALHFGEKMVWTDALGWLRSVKSSAGRAQFLFEKSLQCGPQITHWLDAPPSPEQVAQFSIQAGFGQPAAEYPALFVRDVRSLL